MKRKIRSIYYPFALDPARKRLREENQYHEHVEQLMKQVLLTNPGERVHRPEFGCGIRRMLFSPNTDINANLLQVTIFQALNRWLGTVLETEEVDVLAVDNLFQVTVKYRLLATQERRILNMEVES